MEIKKKTWPKYFNDILSGKKRFEVRLADFDIKEGDMLILEEYDPLTKKYTGRTIRKKVTFTTKFNPLDAWTYEKLKKHGLLEIGLE
jgi:ASC-1-like (ASCH) protein